MITYDLNIDDDVLDALNTLVTQMPRTIQVIIDKQVRPDVERLVIRRLSIEPGKPQYPLRWKSPKQRRYVMMKLRREGKLPYQRTGQLQKSWVVETYPLDRGAGIITRNTAPSASYVIGGDQQPFHMDTGWIHVPSEIPALQSEVVDLFIDAYFGVIEQGLAKGSRFA